MEYNLKGLEYDLLTGLYSRWYCHVELQSIIDNKENCVFCSIDLNGFKRLNHLYGDKKGDELIKAIGKALMDSFDENTSVFRFSGDEFTLIIRAESYSRYQMSVMTRNLFKHLNKICVEGMENERLSFSVGAVFVDPDFYKVPTDIYIEANNLRLEAKKHEGNFLHSRFGSIPDIEGAFRILREDRDSYNSINNSLYKINNEDAWIDYLNKGAKLKESMFHRNQGRIDDIYKYYKENLPYEEYLLLFNLVLEYINTLDVFMIETICCEILIPFFERQATQFEADKCRLSFLYLLLADVLYSELRMGDRSQKLRIKSLLLKTIDLSKDQPHNTLGFEPYFYSLCEIVGHFESLEMQIFSSSECYRYYEELRNLCIGENRLTYHDPDSYKYFEYLVKNAYLFPIYRLSFLKLKGKRIHPADRKEIASLKQYISSRLKDGIYDIVADDKEYGRLAQYLQSMTLEDLHSNEIMQRLIVGLHEIRMLEYGRRSEANLMFVAYLFLASARIVEMTNLSYERKLEISHLGLDFLIELLRKRENISADHQLIFITRVMVQSMTASTILPANEKFYYLEQLMAVVMLDTYCHCKAVARFVHVILSNIIDNQPQLLVGEGRPYISVDDVRANREQLLTFMGYACMLHDVGKMTLSQITSNAYRRLFDREFALIKMHPALGCQILRAEPQFRQFTPFILAHHRWFVGDGGYPNIDSRAVSGNFKVLVDILSICDTLEAATSRIGRNYRNAKSFITILDEIISESGTRYSNEILHSIISSTSTYYELRRMIDYDWKQNYMMIFQEVISAESTGIVTRSRHYLPNPYANNNKVIATAELDSMNSKLPLPEWYANLDEYSRSLYAISMDNFQRKSVMENDSLFFFYDVAHDRISTLFKGPDGKFCQKMGNHFSQQPLNVYISDEGYFKTIETLNRILTDDTFPKEGEAHIEYLDKSRYLLVHYSSVIDRDNKVVAIIGQTEDFNLTKEKMLRTIERQNDRHKLYESLADTFQLILQVDLQTDKYDIIKAIPELRGCADNFTCADDFVSWAAVNLISPESRDKFLEFLDDKTMPERLMSQPYLTVHVKSDQLGWLFFRIAPSEFDERTGMLRKIVFTLSSAEIEQQEIASLSHAASYDDLTGVLNRRKGEEMIRAMIDKGETQIFAILDCDRFKHINDVLSHLVGDQVLREQSRVMRDVFKDFTIMRLGGDEFVVYTNGDVANKLIYSVDGVRSVFEEFKDRLASLDIKELEYMTPSMSCGVVYCNDIIHPTFEQLYEAADEMLRFSKQSRNGTITVNEVRYNEFLHP